MILFGGAGSITGGGQTDRTWAWNGTTWREIVPATRPTARWTHAMAYDPEREVVVLFGGLADDGATPLDDTWEWDGSDCTEVTTASAPSPRGVHGAMTWDGARHTIVLRGGGTVPGSTVFDDTWEYDGTDWSEIPGAGPSARIAPAVAFDEVRGETVLFGGGTWSPYFDGVWTELSPAVSPTARQSARAVFEPTRGVVLLFGGADASLLSDLWEWDGTTWTELAVTGPPPRCCYAFAHDRARAETVLFGGPDDSTWVYGR
jgi:hypothetical protein